MRTRTRKSGKNRSSVRKEGVEKGCHESAGGVKRVAVAEDGRGQRRAEDKRIGRRGDRRTSPDEGGMHTIDRERG